MDVPCPVTDAKLLPELQQFNTMHQPVSRKVKTHALHFKLWTLQHLHGELQYPLILKIERYWHIKIKLTRYSKIGWLRARYFFSPPRYEAFCFPGTKE